MTGGAAKFLSLCNDTVSVVHITSTKDASGGAVAAPGTVAHAGLPASVQPHRSKLHGNQLTEWDQPVIHGHIDVYTLGLFPDLGAQGNGYGVVLGRDNSFCRITNVEAFQAPPGLAESAPDYSMFVCEEVSS